ncbi:alpha/beta fold hydrolase [Balneola sp. MJW-20]|uniref:alpha/beta fold hydrolase n=1 Tax=Gracilimonas aurantiaca TaxID=3234185 RepID=UPI0034656224
MNIARYTFLIVITLVPIVATAQNYPESLSLKEIFHEPFIPGTRPNFSGFSPDSRTLYFRWDDSAGTDIDLFKTDLRGKNIEEAGDDVQLNYTLSPDGNYMIYNERGDLLIANADFSNERAVIASKGFDYNATWNAGSDRFAFVQNGDIWISGVDEAYLKQVTQRSDGEPGYFIIGWLGDDHLAVSQSDNSDYKTYYFPEYVDTYVDDGASRRGVSTSIISVIEIESGDKKELLKEKGWVSTDVSADGNYIAIDWADAPMKRRQISVYDLASDTTLTVFEDSTQGWLYGRSMAFAPSGNTLMLQSEKDGWNHIYTLSPDGSNLQQHTSGDYDIPYVEWLDKNTMLIASSAYDPGDIQLYRLDLRNNNQTQLTEADGHRRGFQLSPDKRYVVYSKTFFNEPFDLYLTEVCKRGSERRITHSVPESFNDYDWQKEDYIRFTGRDGETEISMSVLKPEALNPAGNPVVVFVHGAGSLQNVYKGWSSSYWREYLFNQFLTEQGYYVIEVDYRHSTGYGRKFREDVTNWMGKYETEDIEDGLAYLADNYQSADTSRVGVYGGSYGGFMALYTVSVSPDKFDAAAALRAVTNWDNYYYTNPWYTLPRLGTPEEDPENYERSSPISYADSLEKPVLILHGLIDNNVGFQDAAQYIEELIQNGNENFEMMMYPSERHSFRDQDAWYDEYRRIFTFFEEHLK